MLAMLFLLMFSTLAVGFSAASNTAILVSHNDQGTTLAQTAAESGMDFMRYQLAQIKMPPSTPPNMVMTQLFTQLSANMNGTHNMGSNVVGLSGNVIYVPGDTSRSIQLDLDGLSTFGITITAWGSDIVVKSSGHYELANPVSRSITMDFTAKFLPSTVFNFALASAGQVVLNKGTIANTAGVSSSIASVMSTSAAPGAITVTGGAIAGDLSMLPGASAVVSSGSVGGTSNTALIAAQHEHVVSPAPEFPTVDTSVYASYATNAYVAGAPLQQNIVIPAGTNPQFSAGDTVQGIMYIKSPNAVTFRGTFNLQGFIVFENAGSTAVNSLDFRGNVTQTSRPASAQFDAMRAVSGVSILAPTAAVTMSGSSDSNARGSLITGTFNFGGAANFVINGGTIMSLSTGPNSMVVNGTKSILFTATATLNQPDMGLSYTAYFAPKPSTYQEILP
jgi:hypothetical protein